MPLYTGGQSEGPTYTDVWFSFDVETLDVGDAFDFVFAQLEVGEEATAFEQLTPTENFLDCARYYFRAVSAGATGYADGSGQTARCITTFNYPTEMRVAPSFDSSNATINSNNTTGDINLIGENGSKICTGLSMSSVDAGSMNWRIGSGHIAFDAEL